MEISLDHSLHLLTNANFFNIGQKDKDFRYASYHEMLRKESQATVIHWIGILSLSIVEKGKTLYPLSYINYLSQDVKDRFYQREADGSQVLDGEKCPLSAFTEYDLQVLLPYLLEAKKNGFVYYHIFIEETVGRDGNQIVTMIYDKTTKGVPSKELWINEKIGDYLPRCLFRNFEEMQETTILYNPGYKWMK